MCLLAVAALSMAAPNAVGQQGVTSPEVHADRTVTLRLSAPEAELVEVSLGGKPLSMVRGERGVWEGTSPPLEPGLHDYTFRVDGTIVLDPSNRLVKKWLNLQSMVEVPGDPPLLTEFTDVPHGAIVRLYYPSTSVGHTRPLMVYLPPQYDPTADQRYPLVVLMHGFGDDETAWTEVGRAHFIADNLIAANKIEPVVIAMPYGHPLPLGADGRANDYFGRNNSLYEQDITKDLLPFLESRFKVRSDAAGRSIVGLSMGGGHALDTGLKHLELFSAIGAFSAATPQQDGNELTEQYPALAGPDPAANTLRHLFIPIGSSDFLLDRNKDFTAKLTDAGVRFEYLETSGGHEWKLWREYLPMFLERVAKPDAGR
jgi:enterochelin esterase family protein